MKWTVALSACCVVLLAANIALIHQNSQLKSQLSLPPPLMEASAGTQVPDLRGVDLEGKPVEVLYGKDSRKVLVLVFSPTCPFCDQNWPKWQQVISSLDPLGHSSSAGGRDLNHNCGLYFAAPAFQSAGHPEGGSPGHHGLPHASHAANNPGGSQWKSGEGLDGCND